MDDELHRTRPCYHANDVNCPSGTRCKLDSPKENSCVAKTDAATDGPDAGPIDRAALAGIAAIRITDSRACSDSTLHRDQI